MIIALGACGPRSEPRRAPVIEAPETAGRLSAASPVALASDGGTVYYSDLEGVWALPVAGGDARLVTAPPKLVDRIVPSAGELLLGTADAVLAVSPAGGEVRTVHGGAITTFAVDADGVWIVDGSVLRVVPLAGGAARELGELGEVVAPIVTDADAVYAAIAIDEAAKVSRKVDVQAAAIVRIAKRDGARTQLARRQFGVAGLVRREGRLYWTSFAAGLRSAAVSGGAIETHLGGGGVALAADADGVVVQTTTGLWIEVRPDGARVAIPAGDRQPERAPGIVLAGGALVALGTDHHSGTSALWRERRPWRSPITVAGWVTDGLRELIATGDGVVVLDALLDETANGRVLRIDGRGRRTVLASAAGMSQLAVDGDTLVYRAGDAIWRKDGASTPARVVTVGEEPVLGLLLAGETLYWTDTQSVRTAPAKGGAPTTLYDPPYRSAGTGRPDAELVVDGTTVYINSLGWGAHGIEKVVGPTQAETIYEPTADGVYAGDSLVRAGDALYVSNTGGEIVRAPLAGGGTRVVVKGLDGEAHLVAGGERLLAEYFGESDNGQVIALVDPMKGTLTRVVGVPGESRIALAVPPSGDAVYAGLVGADLIVRIPLPEK